MKVDRGLPSLTHKCVANTQHHVLVQYMRRECRSTTFPLKSQPFRKNKFKLPHLYKVLEEPDRIVVQAAKLEKVFARPRKLVFLPLLPLLQVSFCIVYPIFIPALLPPPSRQGFPLCVTLVNLYNAGHNKDMFIQLQPWDTDAL